MCRAADDDLHTENGMLGMGPEAEGDQIDPDLVNAGKVPVTELPGASYFHHADSFAMMRGGHLDICVLGAYQVSATGDLANWHTGQPGDIPAVGGAMDLATGARQTFVMMNLLSRDGHPKLVPECTYPLHFPAPRDAERLRLAFQQFRRGRAPPDRGKGPGRAMALLPAAVQPVPRSMPRVGEASVRACEAATRQEWPEGTEAALLLLKQLYADENFATAIGRTTMAMCRR